MTIFIHYGIAVSLFAVLLVFGKGMRQLSDRILILFLLSLSSPMMMDLLGLHMLVRTLPMPLTLGPFMGLYAASLTRPNYRLRSKQYLHFLPFTIGLVIALFWLIPLELPAVTPAELPAEPPRHAAGGLVLFFNLAYFVSFGVYTVWTYLLLKKHRIRVLDHFAQMPNRITLQWLSWVVFLFFIIFILGHIPSYLKDMAILLPSPAYMTIIGNVHGAGGVLFIVILSYFGIRQSPVYPAPSVDASNSVAPEQVEKVVGRKSEEKYSSSRLTEADVEGIYTRIDDLMRKEKPYLDAELSITQLADNFAMPRKNLTEVINRKLQKNFFNFVNDYRIEEVKLLLQNPANGPKAILILAYEVGFNSKSTFNAFFKKSTGMTPTEFRKRYAEKP
jgi:AraC-like DNA-binding protein